jgi:hypothetical protein
MQHKTRKILAALGLLTFLAFAGAANATTPSDRGNHEADEHRETNGCRNERGLRSVRGDVHTEMKFLNNSNREVRTYWLDYRGRRVFYKEIPAHDQYTQPTYQTHPWVVTDRHNHCLLVVVSNQTSGIAEIR